MHRALPLAAIASLLLSSCASAPPPRRDVIAPYAKATVQAPTPAPAYVPPPRATPLPADSSITGGIAQRVVQVALRENEYWYQPFIDVNGGLRSERLTEAERGKLADGQTEAWQRVVTYWREGGTLSQLTSEGYGSAYSCQSIYPGSGNSPECRTFLVDTPWSAAFISYVMTKAGVPGFQTSPRHIDYIRQAWSGSGPYAFVNPNTTRPQPGDLLCYVRLSQTIQGYEGLSAAFAANTVRSQPAHCDVVVRYDLASHELQTVGGNVANAVTLRKLRLDSNGLPVLPRSDMGGNGDDDGFSIGCNPNNESQCSMNRQNWAALLRLRYQ